MTDKQLAVILYPILRAIESFDTGAKWVDPEATYEVPGKYLVTLG